MQFEIEKPEDIQQRIPEIVDFAEERMIWIFEGQMGAGKTTLIKEFCDYFQVIDQTSSPTFSLVNVYQTEQHEEIFHFDFYRIRKQQEAVDIGVDDYFYSGSRCLIEWAERIPDLLPEEYLKISINLDHSNQRIIHISRDD